jgi:peptide chain release factor subunit 1
MLAVLDEYPRCGALVVDSQSAHLWELYLDGARDAGELKRASAPSSRPGRSDRRDENNRTQELTKRHFRWVAAAVDELFADERYDVLAVGGHQYELSGFLEFLSPPVRRRMVGTFTIDPHTAGTAAVRALVQDILDRHALDAQQRGVAQLLETVRAGGAAAIGLDECLWAGSVAAIDTLYTQEGAVAPGVVCDQSGWLATSGDTCPLCGAAVRETPDVIDELAQVVVDAGGSVHHVRAETELRKQLMAAALRFALPAMPLADPGP